ncbi:MAG: T9SS type A sorting domain-containing protein [bacterium]|nr:T9SS type A sorting domain-containing protein [bacterium]
MKQTLIIVSLAIIASTAFAQISIDRSEFPQSVGATTTFLTGFNEEVNLGTTGGPQRWDFSQIPEGAVPQVNVTISPDSTPWPSTFNWGSTSNPRYAQLAERGAGLTGGLVDTSGFYTYFRFSTNAFEMLGFGISADTLIPTQAVKPSNSIRMAQIPLNYNATWWDSLKATIDLPDTGGVDLKAKLNVRYQHVVDAYGMCLYPNDSAQTLRQVSVSSGNIQIGTVIFSIFIPLQTITIPAQTQVTWIAENHGPVVTAISDTGITTPNFTRATQLQLNGRRWNSSVSQPLENAPMPSDLVIKAYPNPFNPATSIQVTSDVAGTAVVSITDVLGREVASLYRGNIEAGTMLQLHWNAKASAGVYFVRATVNGMTKSSVLLRLP